MGGAAALEAPARLKRGMAALFSGACAAANLGELPNEPQLAPNMNAICRMRAPAAGYFSFPMASAWNAYPQNFQGARQAPAILAD
jgi:hypothetical protein